MNRLSWAVESLRRSRGRAIRPAGAAVLRGREPYFASHKFGTLERAFRFAKRWGVKGDYFEFGLYRGRSFLAALELGARVQMNCHYYGFDSFSGLPAIEGHDADLAMFSTGQYACTLEKFQQILGQWNVNRERVTLVPGFFEESLQAELATSIRERSAAAIVNLDCDLYQSTVPVLEYLTPMIQPGTILVFDDWFSHAGDPAAGQIAATSEWLEANSELKLIELFRPISAAMVFVVQSVKATGAQNG